MRFCGPQVLNDKWEIRWAPKIVKLGGAKQASLKGEESVQIVGLVDHGARSPKPPVAGLHDDALLGINFPDSLRKVQNVLNSLTGDEQIISKDVIEGSVLAVWSKSLLAHSWSKCNYDMTDLTIMVQGT